MKKINDSNFDMEISKSALPVIVDFYADWCAPCKAMAPLIEKVAEDYDGRVNVFKVNVDDSSEIAARFNVMSIPTFVFFDRNKNVTKQVTGSVSSDVIIRYANDIVV